MINLKFIADLLEYIRDIADFGFVAEEELKFHAKSVEQYGAGSRFGAGVRTGCSVPSIIQVWT
jgi:hypothetical protein